MSSFSAKVCVVTGAGSGIGAASANRMSLLGASVVVVDRDGTAAEMVAGSLPGPAIAVEADVSTEDGVDAYMKAAIDEFGCVELFHLNAGIVGNPARIEDVRLEDFVEVINVNLVGVFLGLRSAFRAFDESSSGGAIVVTASIASLRASNDVVPYQTSKHGVVGLVRSSAVAGAPRGIRVNAVAPGLIPTGLFRTSGNVPGTGGDMAQRAMTTPMRRTGSAEEVAAASAFLLSDDASFVTGVILPVDGGASVVSTVRPSGGAGAWDPSVLDWR